MLTQSNYLTGTPLLGENNTRSLFGDYIHKYYYNSSILDGYTLRLIREEIDTSCFIRKDIRFNSKRRY